MPVTLLTLFDFIGTVAFAISGALVGIHKKMDIFGVNVLAVTTACGGGMIRDLIIGCIPPKMFQNPVFVLVAVVVANIVFLLCYLHRHMPKKLARFYDAMLFWFDSVGLAAFTVDGVMAGVRAGHGSNAFLICFLGFMTAVGGGALRDVMANQMPDIFRKHIYAVAAIAGAVLMTVLLRCLGSESTAMIAGGSAWLSFSSHGGMDFSPEKARNGSARRKNVQANETRMISKNRPVLIVRPPAVLRRREWPT